MTQTTVQYVALAALAVSLANSVLIAILASRKPEEGKTGEMPFFRKSKPFAPKVFKAKSGFGEHLVNQLKKWADKTQ